MKTKNFKFRESLIQILKLLAYLGVLQLACVDTLTLASTHIIELYPLKFQSYFNNNFYVLNLETYVTKGEISTP